MDSVDLGIEFGDLVDLGIDWVRDSVGVGVGIVWGLVDIEDLGTVLDWMGDTVVDWLRGIGWDIEYLVDSIGFERLGQY